MRHWQVSLRITRSSWALLVTGAIWLLGGSAPGIAQAVRRHPGGELIEHQTPSLTQFLWGDGRDFSSLLLLRLAELRDGSVSAFALTDRTAAAVYTRWLQSRGGRLELKNHGVLAHRPPERALSQWPKHLQNFVATYPKNTSLSRYLSGMVIDLAGTLHVIESYGARIKAQKSQIKQIVEPPTATIPYTQSIGVFDSGIKALATDRYSNLYVLTRSKLYQVTPKEELRELAGSGTEGLYLGNGDPGKVQFFIPKAVAVGQDGTVFIADDQRVLQLKDDKVRELISPPGTKGFDVWQKTNLLLPEGRIGPAGLAVDSEDSLFVAYRDGTGWSASNRIFKLAKDRASVQALPVLDSDHRLRKIVVDSSDSLYALYDGSSLFSQRDRGRGIVYKITPDGQVSQVATLQFDHPVEWLAMTVDSTDSALYFLYRYTDRDDLQGSVSKLQLAFPRYRKQQADRY